MDCFERLQAYFRANQVPFSMQHHPLAYTAHDVAASEHISNAQMVKVVMVVADGQLVMLAVPASRRVDEARVEATIGAQELRLAGEDEFASKFMDCDVGAMPPFGNLYGVPVYVDTMLADDDAITFRAGTHTETMTLKYVDFERLVRPRVARLTVADLSHRRQPAAH